MDSCERVIPELPAYQYAGHSIIWCDHCWVWHRHGPDRFGHRLSHCARPDSPYEDSGYVLVDAGPTPPDVLARIVKPPRRPAKARRRCQ
jgi:hypothetical protein